MSKKNLDKIFQEKFSEFSDTPTEKVWKSIEVSLNKKKKNRMVIPFWWKLGGIAAVLAIGLFLVNPFKDDGSGSDTIITDIENLDIRQGEEERAVVPSTIAETPQTNTGEESSNEILNESDKGSDHNVKNSFEPKSNLADNDKSNNAVPKQNATKKESSIAKGNDAIEKKRSVLKDVSNSPKNTEIAANPPRQFKEAAQKNGSLTSPEKNPGHADGKRQLENGENAVAQAIPNNPTQEIKAGEKSIFDEIEDQKKEEIVPETSRNKWSAGPSIAPVYFDAMGKGSPVHSIFVPNSKSGDVNLSYGLAVSYEINKKLSIKTGVHKVDYGYTTNDIEFSSSLEAFGGGQIENIDYSLASRNLIVESKVSRVNSFAENTALDVAAQDPSLLGVMAQQFGYLEIPLELNYTLVDSKFGVSLIGGLSSLFLIDNSVTLTSGELITKMGEANNVNDVNFSTNIGFGLNYKFSQKLRLNIEPVFKYQLNTFSDTSGDFRPFTIGVYSGLNFRF